MRLPSISLKQMIWVMGTLVVLYMGKSVFIDPRVSKANEKTEAYEAASRTLELRISQAKRVGARKDEIEAQIAELRRQLPEEVDIDLALAELRDAFEQAGVTWTSFTPAVPPSLEQGGSTPTTVPVEDGSTEASAANSKAPEQEVVTSVAPEPIKAAIVVTGTFDQVKAAFANLRALSRLVVIDSFATTNRDPGVYAISAEIRLFFYGGRVAEDPPAPDAPQTTPTTQS